MKKFKKVFKNVAYGLAALLVLAYAFWIMYSNYQSQLELRELAIKRVEADFSVRAETIESFLSERQKDINNLAADRTVMTYYENKDLGMTMMYGLAISVRNISKRLSDFHQRSMFSGEKIFSRILLLDEKQNKLAEVVSDNFKSNKNVNIQNNMPGMGHDPDRPDYILISTPCIYKNKKVGNLLAWIPYKFIFNSFLIHTGNKQKEYFLFFAGKNKDIPISIYLTGQLSSLIKSTQIALKESQKTVIDSKNKVTWLIFSAQPDQLPFEAIKLISRNEILGTHNPEKLFMGMITIFTLLFVGIIMLIKLNLKQQINAVRLSEAEERNRRIQEKNKELEIAGKKISQQNEELKELDRLKDDFLANTTHEFKTPLNGILGLTVSILDGQYGNVPPGMIKPLEMINTSGNRLINMVMQILTFSSLSKNEESQRDKQYKDFNLSDIILDIVTDFEHKATAKNIKLITDISDVLELKSDQNLLSSIIRNLLDNALKYTDEGKILIFAETIKDDSENDCIRLIIEDTGIGINEDLQDQIFNRFFQGFASESRKSEGAGIGLSIVKEGLEKLNGSIELFSKEGIGSHFTVILPISPELKTSMISSQEFMLQENLNPELSLSNQESLSETQKENIRDITKKTKEPIWDEISENKKSLILVVDDDAINREVVRSKLYQQYELDFAENGQECLAKIESIKPDLVLLDLMMPGMSGYDVLEHLNNLEFEKQIPVICLSAKTQIASINRALRLGAVDYITKPFNAEELIVRIETHLKQSWLLTKAQESSKLKNEFLANMSHEIRTPMNCVIGMTDILLTTSLSQKQLKYTRMVKDSGAHLLSIINDILDFSRIEAGKLEFEMIDFNIHSLTKSVTELLSINAKENNVKLFYNVSQNVPINMYGDPVRLKQIMMNLAGNAVKFTKDGKVSIKIDIKNETDKQIEIYVSITDTGIGISKENIDRLFSPFIQADGSSTRKYEGTGLGLSISKKLVNLMDGTIGVESQEGKGSTFWFTAFFDKSQNIMFKEEDNKTEDEIVQGSIEDPVVIDDTVKQNTQILLVEDNFINQKVALTILENIGFSADTANNGEEAIEALSSKHYDIVLMDCQMPVLDGISATEKIRSDKSSFLNPDLIIVAMTANAMEGDREKCLNAGMNDFLPKPISADNLKKILFKWTKSKV